MAAASFDGTDSQDDRRTYPDGIRRSKNAVRPARHESDALANARESLHSVPELSEARMSEIKDRIKRGYYGRSDVLDRIAKRLTRHLTL